MGAKYVQFKASAATGASSGTAVGEEDNMHGLSMRTVAVVVSAVSGTSPTLDVYVQSSWDGGTNWYDIAASTQLTAASANLIPISSQGAPSAPFNGTSGTQTASTAKTMKWGDRLRLFYKVGGSDTPTVTWHAEAWFA